MSKKRLIAAVAAAFMAVTAFTGSAMADDMCTSYLTGKQVDLESASCQL